jgi:hypothetical protein
MARELEAKNFRIVLLGTIAGPSLHWAEYWIDNDGLQEQPKKFDQSIPAGNTIVAALWTQVMAAVVTQENL